ncbi:MAG: 2-isopropylmalate synthase [Clostridia bacterium]|nr:2-isopropylmalate synthase [Clostridia bacterium]
MSMRKIKIFDTTLRDGEQSPGCSMNLQEKLDIARQLVRLGVDVIEAGFPASSKGDAEAVTAIASAVKGAVVCALARCVRSDIDAAAKALSQAEHPRIHVFIATSEIHMQYKLKMSREQVLDAVRECVSYARSLCGDVQFSAEDATRSDRGFLCRVLQTAADAGAATLNIPDTVGYTTPAEMASLIEYVKEHVKGADSLTLAAHCHNDLGLAVANSLSAVAAGAGQVECTVNGIGERAGNAALEEIVMGLKIRGDATDACTGVDTTQIYRTSRLVYATVGAHAPKNKPIVGDNAFSHEAGIHQHGVMNDRRTYEIMRPEDIGVTERNMSLGKHSGRHAFEKRLAELGYTPDKAQLDAYFEKFKELADRKKDITDRDLEAIASERAVRQDVFTLDRFTVQAGNRSTPTCVIRLEKNGEKFEDVAIGDGPVDAAYKAVDKIICPPDHELYDYSIHSISGGKDALGEVTVKLRMKNGTVTGRGLSTDVIEASILAYINAVNRMLERADDEK